MSKLKVFLSSYVWRYSLSYKQFLKYGWFCFTITWTIYQFITKFFVNFKLHYMVLVLFGIVGAIWMCRPRLTKRALSKNKVLIEVKVDDIFKLKAGALIIPINSELKLNGDEKALPARLREQFFSSTKAFEGELQRAFTQECCAAIEKQGEHEPHPLYPIGSAVRLPLKAKRVTGAYMLVTANLNKSGRAIPDYELYQRALKELWVYIGQHGRVENLIIPIMGSGRNRLTKNRFDLIKEIIDSFLQAIQERKFTEKLTIVIYPEAFMRNEMNLNEIAEYLKYRTKFDSD